MNWSCSENFFGGLLKSALRGIEIGVDEIVWMEKGELKSALRGIEIGFHS